MRILFSLVFFVSYLATFSQKPVEKEEVVPLDSLQELGWKKPDADTTLVIVNPHKPPVFPGGDKELLKFIAENARWPEGCGDKSGVGAGRIVVQFVVDTFGQTVDWKILKTPSKCFEPMVAEVFAKMPCWEPGEWLGNRVRTRMVLPILIHWE